MTTHVCHESEWQQNSDFMIQVFIDIKLFILVRIILLDMAMLYIRDDYDFELMMCTEKSQRRQINLNDEATPDKRPELVNVPTYCRD